DHRPVGSRAGRGLLNDVGELVRQDLLAHGAARLILAAPEEDVLARREGPGPQGPGQAIGTLIRVHPDPAELSPHRPLKPGAYRLGYRPAARARLLGDRPLHLRPDDAAGVRTWRAPGGQSRRRAAMADDLLRDAVRGTLMPVVRWSDPHR